MGNDGLVLHTSSLESIVTNRSDFESVLRVSRYNDSLTKKEFPQLRDNEFESIIIGDGLRYLTPTTNLSVVKNRESMIKIFIEDYKSDKNLLNYIRSMHVAARVFRRLGPADFDKDVFMKENGSILERFADDSNSFLSELSNFSPEISESYKSQISFDSIETTVLAAENGRYNFLFTDVHNSNLINVFGVMDSKLYVKHSKNYESDLPSFFETLDSYLVFETLNKEYYDLLYQMSVFPALYAEALSAISRENDGKPYCFASVSDKQHISLIDAEPLLKSISDPVPSTIISSPDYIRFIFSGIHSGGKSILLQTIPEYVLQGMSGLVLPAREVVIPLIKEIVYSMEVEEKSYVSGGKLHSEIYDRLRTLNDLDSSKMYVCDEFLQHASPDAAEYLEPTILSEIVESNAASIIVTHRGDSVDESVWDFYHPQFIMDSDKIVPSYQFGKGKPSEEILKKHALQLFNKTKPEHFESSYSKSSVFTVGTSRSNNEMVSRLNSLRKKLIEGSYKW